MDFMAQAEKLLDALKPRKSGEHVNVHVIHVRSEPKPDYEAMRRLLEGENGRVLAAA